MAQRKDGKKKSRRPHQNAHSLDQFLMLLNENFSQRAAARIARIKAGSITTLLNQPAVLARQEELRQIVFDNVKVANRAQQAMAEVDHARSELCEMAVYGEGKKPGRIRSCSVLLQSHGLIEAPGPKAVAGAMSGTVNFGTMEDIYKSQWLRDKEAALAQRFEKEATATPLTLKS
jgi:hypothetical protein